VSFTFDVDGPAGLACRPVAGGWAGRLSGISEGQFGITRGLGRVLRELESFGVAGTFYVPGVIAEREPAAVREIAAAGHEVAHHGHEHRPSHTLDAAGQRDEIERGLAALEHCLGERPAGYRSPAWELTPITLALLGEHGFAYDSSLMGDDRPYRLAAGTREIVELPVHWSLDDVPFLAWAPERGGLLGDPRAALAVWSAEHDAARHEDRHVTYTMHPEIIGRAHRIGVLHALLDHVGAAGTPALTHAAAAALA
jgi:peptidoglycan/xylan/chitin deacetylase (PgdA/CDA1 family)